MLPEIVKGSWNRLRFGTVFVLLIYGCVSSPSKPDPKYYHQYPKTSESATILLNLHSNIQRTTFFIDGKKMAIGRRMKVLIDDGPHTVLAVPEGYRGKEEFIQPPYMRNSLLSFIFLLEDRLTTHEQKVPVAAVPPKSHSDSMKAVPKSSATSKRMYAVIVGISKYEYASDILLPNLLYADNDAKAFTEMLGQMGWSDSNIKTLIDGQSTFRNIKIALDSWLTKAGPDDLIVLYWSGHGYPDPEDPTKVYFACYDTDPAIPATGFRMDDVRRSIEEKGSKNVLVFADTCHAGKLITRGNKGIAIVPQVNDMRNKKTIPKGWIFMVGADTDRQAIEHTSWANGAFTHCLIKALSGEADGFESVGKKDGLVTMGEVRAFLSSSMPDQTQKVLGVAKRAVIATSAGDPDIWELTLHAK